MEVALIVVPIVLGVIALVVVIVLSSRHFEKKRSAEMAGAADELGLAFFMTGHEELLQKLQRFKLFTTGHSRIMRNVILGETEVASIAIFDYRYTTGGGKNNRRMCRLWSPWNRTPCRFRALPCGPRTSST